jgi:hypothetical protein
LPCKIILWNIHALPWPLPKKQQKTMDGRMTALL